MSTRGVTRKRRRPFDAGDFILGRQRTGLLVVPRSLRLLHCVVHCVGYGLHHPDTTGERYPASPNLQSGASRGTPYAVPITPSPRCRGITAIRRSGALSTPTGDTSSRPCRPDPCSPSTAQTCRC